MPRSPIRAWCLTAPVDFRISRRRIRYSHHLLVRVSADGQAGWGAAPLYGPGPHQLPAAFRDVETQIGKALGLGPTGARQQLADHFSHVPDILCAVDGALWDLQGRLEGMSVCALLGGTPTRVPITEQVFVTDLRQASASVAASLARGVTSIKVKLAGSPRHDLMLMRRLREMAGPDVELRVDANRSYSTQAAIRLASELVELGVRQWEEPVSGTFVDAARFRSETQVQVILDESVRSEAELDDALAAGALDLLNVKLGRLGGITLADRYRRKCVDADVAIAIGCAEEIGPGMAAILHVSAAWKPQETEGIGADRLGFDVATPTPKITDGSVDVTDAPGWGLDVDPAGGRAGDLLVAQEEWTRRFQAVSWLRHQRQRAGNARLRLIAAILNR